MKESPSIYPETGSIESLRGKCVSKAKCINCDYAFECQNAWKAKEAQGNFETAEAGHAYKILNNAECS